ncbi:MAG: helix-turn-helix domain-containing protein [Syntrophomonas sp.]
MATKNVKWEDAPDILTVQQAAALSQLGVTRMYKLCRLEGFPVLRIGNMFRIPKEIFHNWLVQQAQARAEISVDED